MSASATDYFTKVGIPGTATTLSAPGHTIGGTSLTVVATTNWPTSTGTIFAMDTVSIVNGVQVRDVGSYTEWEGVVASATSITGLVLREGTDQNYPAGTTTRVYIPVAGSQNDRMVDGLVLEHKQTGLHSAVTADSVTVATGKITTTAVSKLEDAAVPLSTYRSNFLFDYVVSGGVWTADSVGVNLNASMTAIVCMINGRRISIGAVTARAFTTNVDTYIDVLDNADGTGTLVYTTAATNAASPALAANSIRIGIIQAAATITATTKVNQGQEDRVFPIASSIPYSVTDSLGNLICPRDPNRKILGYRQILATFSTASGSAVQITGLTCPVIVPTGRKVKISVYSDEVYNGSGASSVVFSVWSGVVSSGTQLNQAFLGAFGSNNGSSQYLQAITSPASGLNTFNAGLLATANTASFAAGSNAPGFILVELV